MHITYCLLLLECCLLLEFGRTSSNWGERNIFASSISLSENWWLIFCFWSWWSFITKTFISIKLKWKIYRSWRNFIRGTSSCSYLSNSVSLASLLIGFDNSSRLISIILDFLLELCWILFGELMLLNTFNHVLLRIQICWLALAEKGLIVLISQFWFSHSILYFSSLNSRLPISSVSLVFESNSAVFGIVDSSPILRLMFLKGEFMKLPRLEADVCLVSFESRSTQDYLSMWIHY